MADRTPRRQSERPTWADEKKAKHSLEKKDEESRLFRRRDDIKDEVDELKEYVRGKPRQQRPRKDKEFKGTDKKVTPGLRFDSTDPMAVRRARREAEGKHFVAPEAPELKPRKGMKRLRAVGKRPSNAETSRKQFPRAPRTRDAAATAEQIRELPGAPRERSAMRDRLKTRDRSVPQASRVFRRREDQNFPGQEPSREYVEPKRVSIKDRRELAKKFDEIKLEKPKKKKEGRKYDRPSTTPGERVQKLIANAGITSRREAEKWIEEGRVEVNGRVIKLGDKALPNDKVTVNGAPITFEKHSYYMLHKPKGFVTTRDDKVYKNKTVMDLIPVEERIYPVGRLDKDTTGLLIFTNDGEFANKLMHPRYEVEKVYIATLDKPFNTAHVSSFEKGIRLKEGVVTAHVRPLSARKVEVTLHQGFNHVVKRIMKEMGYWVTDLARVKVGPLTLDIPLGAYRPLLPEEVSLFSRPRSRPGIPPRGR